jgi:hypothetical protein
MIFSYNEVFGPFTCEVSGCKNEAWNIVISEEEETLIPNEDRFEQSCFVFNNNMGQAICEEHLVDFSP